MYLEVCIVLRGILRRYDKQVQVAGQRLMRSDAALSRLVSAILYCNELGIVKPAPPKALWMANCESEQTTMSCRGPTEKDAKKGRRQGGQVNSQADGQ
jgi:hypothetical protein